MFCLTLPVEDDRTLGGPGLDLEAEDGLLGKVVFKFEGVSFDISGTFNGLDLTVGETPREGLGFFATLASVFVTKEDLIGVEALDVDLEVGVMDLLGFAVTGNETCEVGVLGLLGFVFEGNEAREVGVLGLLVFEVEGIEAREVGVLGLLGFFDEGPVAREVGVDDLAGLEVGEEGLEGLFVAGNVARPVGVAGLEAVDLGPPDDEGLEDIEGFTVSKFLETGSVYNLPSLDSGAVMWPFGSISNEGKSGVSGGVRSQS